MIDDRLNFKQYKKYQCKRAVVMQNDAKYGGFKTKFAYALRKSKNVNTVIWHSRMGKK